MKSSKGLEALNKLIMNWGLQLNPQWEKDIEKELKDYEEIKDICFDYGIEFSLANIREALFTLAQLEGEHGNGWINYNNKLRALKIIVEKKVNVPTLKAYMLEKPTDEWALAEYNTWCKETQDCIYYEGRDYLKSIPLTKEEFDLLKEVML